MSRMTTAKEDLALIERARRVMTDDGEATLVVTKDQLNGLIQHYRAGMLVCGVMSFASGMLFAFGLGLASGRLS